MSLTLKKYGVLKKVIARRNDEGIHSINKQLPFHGADCFVPRNDGELVFLRYELKLMTLDQTLYLTCKETRYDKK
ncbi:MAG: hypothetical protein JWQ09_1635 [Segetibacter sp.]|nr:hypothetical protein [Segetibacter sp.]